MSQYRSGSISLGYGARRSPRGRWTAVAVIVASCGVSAAAKPYTFENITERTGAPGQGNAPDINIRDDIAFDSGASVYFYDRSEGTFLNVTALPGAPAGAWFPRLNGLGNIVMIESSTRDLWFFEAATQTFTNIAALPNYPGNSQAHGLQLIFALNDDNKVSFHSGDLNFGRIYVYDHATGAFEEITNKPGGSWHGRENTINNAGQVGYMGFPSLYVYDPATGVTTNISTLPGGPNTLADSFALNDRGDAATFRPDEVVYYEASSGAFLYLSTLSGFPPGAASSYGNDLSDLGVITFWRVRLYAFDTRDQSFTQLNDYGPVPAGGMTTSINAAGRIAMAAGLASVEDIYLAIPAPASDLDGDGDVDLADFGLLLACFNGPSRPPVAACTADADFDVDNDVDLADFATFLACFNGPNRPPACP